MPTTTSYNAVLREVLFLFDVTYKHPPSHLLAYLHRLMMLISSHWFAFALKPNGVSSLI